MRKMLLTLGILQCAAAVYAAPPAETNAGSNWKAAVTSAMPLLGHRNWILIVDSAYPLQVTPGIQTVETGEPMHAVARFVLGAVKQSIHVRSDIFMDAELPFVPDQDAPGASEYRRSVRDLLRGYTVVSQPHEKLLSQIAEAGNTLRILVLKTNATVPYSSIFIRLNCKYWSDDAEQRLRARMAAGSSGDR